MQPLWWLGLVMTVVLYSMRLRKERKEFRIAVNKDFYEGRHFIKKGFVFFILGSLLLCGLGVMLPPKLIFIYEISALIALLVSVFFEGSLIALLVVLVYQLTLEKSDVNLLSSIFVLFFMFFSLRLLFLRKVDIAWFTPRIKQGKRGRRIAYYLWREFSVFPILILIPGDMFRNVFSFWPVFSFNGYTFSLCLIPFLIGINCKALKQTIQAVLNFHKKQTKNLVLYSLISIFLSYFNAKLGVILSVGLVLILIWQHYKHHLFEQQANSWYVETNDGVRIIAVQSNTPAAKMKLTAGDVILTCNGQKVTSESELYEALQLNSAYCIFKVRNFAGELKMAQGAIYADAPHELGLILFH